MSNEKSKLTDANQRQRAIFRWDNEGGAGLSGPQSRSVTYPDLIHQSMAFTSSANVGRSPRLQSFDPVSPFEDAVKTI